ncbi:hypothetical protein [Sphingomonas sp. DBB INV C78]|uniref:hypothetical protein n=1 Tax=Sphingomonas sp. DBB INV C78 TaxID=3349434 RepID=UPI0036D22076
MGQLSRLDEEKSGNSPSAKPLFFLGMAFAVAGLTVSAIMIERGGADAREAVKLLLQFFLITGVGAVLVAALAFRRDNESLQEQRRKDAETKRLACIKALQDLDAQLGRSYRELKAVKRNLRALLIDAERDAKGRAGPPYLFPTEGFRKCMAELMTAQIRLEDIRGVIQVQKDLLDDDTIDRLRDRLRYATRFFHDVHEDVERGKVAFDGSSCRVTAQAANIDSLLNSRALPSDLPEEVKGAIKQYLKDVSKGGISLEVQHRQLEEIERLRNETDPKHRRFRAIADDCFALAAAEIQLEIARRLGLKLSTPRDLTHRSYDSEEEDGGTIGR